MFDEQVYWLGFSLIPGIGRKSIEYLLGQFRTLADAWHADENALRRADIKPERIIPKRADIDLNTEIARLIRARARLITLIDDDYPALLKPLADAPPVLYVRGTLSPHDTRALAVVGTRRATSYGRDATTKLVGELAANGVTIISGLAQGIDAAAHSVTLREGGRTIAVLGSGIDIIYPRENTALAQKITEQGALISEFPIGASPNARNFPRRNRVISGLALGLLVVEAPEDSGALITATYAAEQGRDVFAVPANIFNPSGTGTNRLIQEGAKLVTSASDILEELNLSYDNLQTRHHTERIQPDNAIEAALVALMGADPIHIDELVRQSGLNVAQVTSTLTILELKGLAQMVGHMQYSLLY